MARGPIQIEAVEVSVIRPLRHRVLRDGLPAQTAVFPGDDDPGAVHLGALNAQGLCVGCVTLHPSQWDGEPAWQLRGMATDACVRGTGVGRQLLDASIATGIRSGPHRFWCNARVPAAGFYHRHGWTVVSGEFDVPTAGPHVKMTFTAASRGPG